MIKNKKQETGMKKLLAFLSCCILFVVLPSSANNVLFQLNDGEINFSDEELKQLRKASTTIDNLFSDAEPELGDVQKLPLTNLLTSHFEFIKNYLQQDEPQLEKNIDSLTFEQLLQFLIATDFLDMQTLMNQIEKKITARLLEPSMLDKCVTDIHFLNNLKLPITLQYRLSRLIAESPLVSFKQIFSGMINIPIKKLCTHGRSVQTLYVSHQQILFSGASDGTINMWNSTSGKLLRTLLHHHAPITCLKMNVDNTLLFSTSLDGTIGVWNTASGELIRSISHEQVQFFALELKEPNILFASASDGKIYAFNFKTGENLSLNFPPLTKTWALCLTKNNILFSGENNGKIRAWDASQATELFQVPGHSKRISALALKNDVSLFSSSDDGSISIYDISSKQIIKTLNPDKRGVEAFTLDNDALLFASYADNKIRTWNHTTGQILYTLPTPQLINALAYRSDEHVFAGCSDGSIYVTDFLQLKKLLVTLSRNLDLYQLLLFVCPMQIDLNTAPQFAEPFHNLDQELKTLLLKSKKVIQPSDWSRSVSRGYQFLKSFFNK